MASPSMANADIPDILCKSIKNRSTCH
jgi:hypothetical protein